MQKYRFFREMRQALPLLLLLPSITLILSAVMAWANVGFGDEFVSRWGRGFVTSLVVLPLILVFIGAVERMVDRVFTSLHWVARKLVVVVLTACTIETVLAIAVTATSHPWDSTFGTAWWMAFSRSLPVGLVISMFMTFYMKPKIDQMRKRSL